MFGFAFADPSDKVFRYKRQTYLLAFPIGIAICLLYILGSLGNTSLRMYIAIAMVVELGVFVLLLFIRPDLMRAIEFIFYITFSTYFFILTQDSIYSFRVNGGLTPSELADVLNGLSMWLIVFTLGAYLTTTAAYVRFLLVYIFAGLIAMAANNIWFLYSTGTLQFTFIFRWLNSFASLSMATLLIQRMGVLQQSYASTDSLTGLLNRRTLYQLLARETERSARYRKPFSIVLFDIDHFKQVNDTHGHLAGDTVLRGISKSVSQAIRQMDYLGRWGGEEFLLILPETDTESARCLAERICQMLRKSRYGKIDHVTASFGITTFRNGCSLEEMLHEADRAMYQAKQNGRGQVFVNSA